MAKKKSTKSANKRKQPTQARTKGGAYKKTSEQRVAKPNTEDDVTVQYAPYTQSIEITEEPKGFHKTIDGETTIVTHRWSSSGWKWQVVIAFVWNVLAWASFYIFLSAQKWIWLAVDIPFVLIGVIMIIGTLIILVNKTVFRITPHRLEIQNGPLVLKARKMSLEAQEIKQFFVKSSTAPQTEKGVLPPMCSIYAIRKDGEGVALSKAMDSTTAVYIYQELQQLLKK